MRAAALLGEILGLVLLTAVYYIVFQYCPIELSIAVVVAQVMVKLTGINSRLENSSKDW